MFVLLLYITTGITEESEDESTEIEYATENYWSTSDLGITMLMLPVIVVVLCNFLFYASCMGAIY